MSQSLSTELAKRVATALFFGPLAIAVVLLANKLFFTLFTMLVALVCTWEMSGNILKNKKRENLAALVLTSLCFIPYLVNLEPPHTLFLGGFLLILFLLILVDNSKWLDSWKLSLPSLYIGLPLSLLVDIWSEMGRRYVLFLLLLVWVSDMAAYFVGGSIGRRLLMPRISPKKTVEGFLGSLVFTTLLSVPMGLLLLSINLEKSAILGLVISLSSSMGDLLESSMKRHASLKDTSNLLPGHGGFLDRFDSTIFSIPFFLLAAKILL